MATQTALTYLPLATRRLLRDYAEVERAAIGENVSARPLEANIFEWHASMRNGPLTVHLMLVFPKNYPHDPPSVTLFTPVPHANVVPSLGGYRICLDMLNPGSAAPYEGWSKCYSVASILRQLQAFIFDPAFQLDQHGTDMTLAVQQAKQFVCTKCPYTYDTPWPSFPNEYDLAKSAPTVVRRRVIAPPRKTPALPLIAPAAEGDDAGWTVVKAKRRRNLQPAKSAHITSKSGVWIAVVKSPSVIASKPKAKKLTINSSIALAALRGLTIAPPPDAKPAMPVDSDICNDLTDALLTAGHGKPTSAGPLFSRLPQEILVHILCSRALSTSDIVALSKTCRHLYAACQDGHIWRALFGRRNISVVTAAELQDWKTALAMEENCATDEMRCSVTKVTWEEDVLGLPIVYTVNPKTKSVDYINCEEGMLSRSAFYSEKIRRTIWNVKFEEWMPVYLTHAHFLRAVPDLERFFLAMSPQHNTRLFRPEMVAEVLAKMMNTLIVLLCDEGVAVSSQAIEQYFVLRRLLVACIDHYPKLQAFIDSTLGSFINGGDTQRHKTATPSIGNILPLLSVSKAYRWSDWRVRDAFLSESGDRSVLWICTKHPSLARVPSGVCKKPSMDVLKQMWEGSEVSNRLTMFHVAALQLFKDDTEQHCDVLFGRPPKRVVDQFQAQTKKIMNVSFWPGYYAALMHPVPTPLQLTAQWRRRVDNSLRKGYHRRGMDFAAVHRSGVSRILLKGKSYSAPPDIDTVVMDETWRWAREDGQQYLDATCSVFDFQDKHLEHVCWSHTYGQGGSVVHSGDVIDHALLLGTHSITIRLRQLSASVKSLVFCMSAFTGDLVTIKHPTVAFNSIDRNDRELKTPLCRYDFVKEGSLRGKTNVVMCILWRATAAARWQVTARGDIGFGRAADDEWLPMMLDMAKALREL
ncbi:Ubiquitin-conjugating enzyme E2 2 [Geranomyces variabilis]|nr:Ubiquitin-conjugating enzyme E2 2 [Geranomyces variabilis]